jgi:hypothetical protein
VVRNTSSFIESLYADKPSLHRGETEVSRPIVRSESFLKDRAWNAVPWSSHACHGLSRDVAEFLDKTISDGWQTLETGSGLSTLIFARGGAWHTAITPNSEEFVKIKDWAHAHGIDLTRLTCIPMASEDYLPTCPRKELDCVFIDGKHAFPWPILDWFFAARQLRRGGLLILDDIDMAPVRLLVDFLSSEAPRWQLVQRFDRSVCFRKNTDSIEDVAWHMQLFVARSQRRTFRQVLLGAKRRLKL